MANSNNTYLFYDLETTGLHKAFDQVLQFAGKRLHADFSQEKESLFYEVQLNKDVIPSPMALLTHQVDIHNNEQAMQEHTAISLIHRHMNAPHTISLGYNTLGFDDEFLRFSFYRNLLAPYSHQYANGCKRMDVFPITVFYYLYASDSVIWPQVEGKVSLKLEALAAENGWLTGRAHHAMVDVDATIMLAKKLRASHPEVWNYCAGFFDKPTDYERISQLPEAFNDATGHHLGLMVHAIFGAEHAFQAPVVSLGRHNHYKNQIVFLRLDKPIAKFNYPDLDAAGLIIRKKLAEPGFLIPYNDHYARHMCQERKTMVEKNLANIRMHLPKLDDVSHEAREYTHPTVQHIDVDAALYDSGFLSADEEQACHRFHIAGPEQKAHMLQDWQHSNLQQRAARMLWRHYPEHLPAPFKKEMQQHFSRLKAGKAIVDYRGNHKYTLPQALADIQHLQESQDMDPSSQALLKSLTDYLQRLADQ